MSGSNLSYSAPPAEVLSPREAQSLSNRIETAVSSGVVHETLRIDGLLDRLQVAARPPSQAQRNATRRATDATAPATTSANQQGQRQVAAAPRAARL